MRFIKYNFQNAFQKLTVFGAAIMILCATNSMVAAQQENSAKKVQAQSMIYEAEKLLADLGYWITKIDGVSDTSTRHATVAFQKVERRRRTGILNAKELEAMRAAARPVPRFTGAEHIEADLNRQVLFLVDGNGTVTRILPVSSGTDKKYFSEGKWETAHTPRGNFKITRQIFGVRRAPLGNLYYPNYFSGGVAIHGSASIPFQPASHGCVRIPNFAAREFQTLVAVGMPVFVYD